MLYQPSVGADEEFHQVARVMGRPQPFMLLATSYVAPPKIMNGMVVLADGVQWDPGSGAGFYGYRNGAWQLLG
jgi:hypothetical protein